MNVYCVKGLMEISNISNEIAKLFCPHVTTFEIIGDLKDLKFGLTEKIMNIYTTSFAKISGKYGIKANMWFDFSNESF